MLSKLLSLLSTAKGAAAATAIAAAAVTTGVAATDQDVRDAVTNTIHDVTERKAAEERLLFLSRGSEPGHHEEDWLRAESELRLI